MLFNVVQFLKGKIKCFVDLVYKMIIEYVFVFIIFLGGFFLSIFFSLFGIREMRILILGLDGVGKIIILYRLQVGEVVIIIFSKCWYDELSIGVFWFFLFNIILFLNKLFMK